MTRTTRNCWRFYALEASGWKGREESAIANDPTRLRFFNELARAAAQYGYLTLCFLEHSGRAIAADFGLTYSNRYSAPKCAYDDQYKQYGPGHLLVNAVLGDCAARGLAEYEFLAHAEEWKRRWTRLYRPHAYWFVFRTGICGRIARSAKFQVNPILKNALGPGTGFPRAAWKNSGAVPYSVGSRSAWRPASLSHESGGGVWSVRLKSFLSAMRERCRPACRPGFGSRQSHQA